VAILESEYVHVADRAAELGCAMPDGLALMPDNFHIAPSRHDLVVRAEGVALRALFEQSAIPLGSFYRAGEHPVFGHDGNLHWEAGLFVSAAHGHTAAQALTLIAGHLDDFFKGRRDRQVGLALVVERRRDRTCRKLTYRGDTAGLAELAHRARQVAEE
jgi:hypothetical protein